MAKYFFMAVTIFIVGVTAPVAHQGATGIVKERMDAMSDMSDRTKLIAKMFKGEKELDRTYIRQASESFASHGEALFTQFPDTHESRMGSDTEALPSIWDDWDGFEEQINQFIAVNGELQTALDDQVSDKKLRKTFLTVARSCKSCHKNYRQE
ncbi:hypothetical protein AB833_13800 [Chromatiales bacterium (ex Bugula neritina AB1)]|nr:hypothetical protein AB833_13800 [Chromatiales bacterium (ex Bugula neritina AB1)]